MLKAYYYPLRRIDSLKICWKSWRTCNRLQKSSGKQHHFIRCKGTLLCNNLPVPGYLRPFKNKCINYAFSYFWVCCSESKNWNASELTREERISIKVFKKYHHHEKDTEAQEVSFAEGDWKRQKRSSETSTKVYEDTIYILPTCNICERLFSQAGYALNDRRRAVIATNYEAQILLFWNDDL